MPKIRLGGLLPAGNKQVRKFKPQNGEKIAINYFNGTGNVEFRLFWKYETPEQELIWVIPPKTYNPMIFEFEPPVEELDGENEFAVEAENMDLTNNQLGAFLAEFSRK